MGVIRKVAKPLKVATGDVLPAGTICGVDTHHIHFNNTQLDNPEEFDGLRYVYLCVSLNIIIDIGTGTTT